MGNTCAKNAEVTLPPPAPRSSRSSAASGRNTSGNETDVLPSIEEFFDRSRRPSVTPEMPKPQHTPAPAHQEAVVEDQASLVVMDLMERRGSAVKRPAPTEAESIGTSIIESGRASVRRASLGGAAPPPSPELESQSHRSSLTNANGSAERREARRARFSLALDDVPATGAARPSNPSPEAADDASIGFSLVERQLAARRSVRRGSI